MIFENIKIKDVKKEMGSLARTLRKRDKVSQQGLANQLGLSRITIQNLESGNNFTIDTYLKVMQHFDLLTNLNDLFIGIKKDNENIKSLY